MCYVHNCACPSFGTATTAYLNEKQLEKAPLGTWILFLTPLSIPNFPPVNFVLESIYLPDRVLIVVPYKYSNKKVLTSFEKFLPTRF